MEPDTFLTTTYVIVDDLCQAKSGEVGPKRRGRKQVLSESEVITLALLSRWHGRGLERAFLRFAARHWRSYFPLIGQSGSNKRVRALRSRIAGPANTGRAVACAAGPGASLWPVEGAGEAAGEIYLGRQRIFGQFAGTPLEPQLRGPHHHAAQRIRTFRFSQGTEQAEADRGDGLRHTLRYVPAQVPEGADYRRA